MKLNKNCMTLIEFKNKEFLKPILNVEDKLLAPLLYNDYILNEIENIQFILSRIPNSNIVKVWLLEKLKHDEIIINAKISERSDEVLNKIKNLVGETYVEKYIRPNLIYRYFNKIEEDNLNTKSSSTGIFDSNKSQIELDKRLLVDNKLNKLFIGCYILTFNNKFYYYIGSSTNLKERINSHYSHIEEYIKALEFRDYKAIKENSLNEMIKNYLNCFFLSTVSEKDGKVFNSQKVCDLGFNFKILYLSPNYLNLFRSIHPKHELLKGEWQLLNKINDFLTKFLETTLICKFQPKLNIASKPLFKQYEWDEEFLNERNNEIFNDFDFKKYKIYICITKEKTINLDHLRNTYLSNKVPQYFLNDYDDFPPLTYDERLEYLIYVSTLKNICYNYNLRPYEVLRNLGKYHHYKGTILKNPLKIVEDS